MKYYIQDKLTKMGAWEFLGDFFTLAQANWIMKNRGDASRHRITIWED